MCSKNVQKDLNVIKFAYLKKEIEFHLRENFPLSFMLSVHKKKRGSATWQEFIFAKTDDSVQTHSTELFMLARLNQIVGAVKYFSGVRQNSTELQFI